MTARHSCAIYAVGISGRMAVLAGCPRLVTLRDPETGRPSDAVQMTWIKVQKLRTNASGTVSKIISVGGTNACRIEPQEGGQVAVAPKKQTRG